MMIKSPNFKQLLITYHATLVLISSGKNCKVASKYEAACCSQNITQGTWYHVAKRVSQKHVPYCVVYVTSLNSLMQQLC